MAKTEEMNLFQKLAAIRKMVEALQKNKDGYGYKYVSEDEILAKVTAGLEKYRVDVYPRIKEGTSNVIPYFTKKTKIDRKGNMYEENVNEVIVSTEAVFEWVNIDNPSEKYEIPWLIVGQQGDASQALGSGLTYCTRYFFLKFFKSSTLESDPDNWRSKQEEAKNTEERLLAAEIVKEIDETISKNVSDENRKGLIEEIKKYVKKNGKASADYFAVTDPKTASDLLKAVNVYFGKTEREEN